VLAPTAKITSAPMGRTMRPTEDVSSENSSACASDKLAKKCVAMI